VAQALAKSSEAAKSRALWADKLVATYAGDAAALARLKGDEARNLVEAIRLLGNAEKAASLAEQVATAKSLPPAELALVTGALQGCGEAGKASRQRVAESLTGRYAADTKAMESIPLGVVADFARHLGDGLTQERRALWVRSIRVAYVDRPGALRSLGGPDIQKLVSTLQLLGDKNASGVVASWMLSR
jgi:hypothetical protein